jgi:hypothetical protein
MIPAQCTAVSISPGEFQFKRALPTTISDLDLSLFVPRYKVMKISHEFGGNLVIHLRRKHAELPLFVKSFYLACYTTYVSCGVNPESCFNRTYYNPNAYVMRDGKLGKDAITRTFYRPYLHWYKLIETYKNSTVTSYLVTARFNDRNNRALDMGLTVNASSINTRLFICKEMLGRIGNPETFDYASFYEDLLARIGYPKAAYIIASHYKSIHRLHALQASIRSMIARGEFS